jgi:hypothetical protein
MKHFLEEKNRIVDEGKYGYPPKQGVKSRM